MFDQALPMDVLEALEQVDADSWESLCRAVPAEVRQTLQLHVERRGNVVLTRCLVNDGPLVNRAIALGMGEPLTVAGLRALKDEFASYGLKNFALQISPHGMRGLGSEQIAETGLVEREHWVKLLRGNGKVADIPADGIVVREVEAGDFLGFGDVSVRGFGRPPIIAHWMGATVGDPRWRHYLAWIDGQPAGAAALYWQDDYAWLGIGSTLPEYRQRGVQQRLIAARLQAGLALGVKYFVAETESRNVSCGNLQKAGFEVVYERCNYGIAPAATS